MDSNVFAVFGTLVAVSLGFLLNEVSTLLRRRREDKRILRRALFRLIDLHHLISPFDSDRASSVLRDWIQSKDPLSAATINLVELNEMFNDIFDTFVTPLQQKSINDMKEFYEKAFIIDLDIRFPTMFRRDN